MYLEVPLNISVSRFIIARSEVQVSLLLFEMIAIFGFAGKGFFLGITQGSPGESILSDVSQSGSIESLAELPLEATEGGSSK